MTPGLHPAHADDGDVDAFAHLANLREGDRAHRRPGDAARDPAQPRPSGAARVQRHAADRVDERDGIGAVALGGGGDGRGRGAVGRQLDDQRLGRARAHGVEQRRRLAGVGAHQQPGPDVRARDVELDRAHLGARGDRRDQLPDIGMARAHDVDDQRHRERRELGQVLGQEALEPLVGQPDRVDHPGAQLPQPGRRVALPRGERDRLGDERGERETLVQRLAERAPGGDRVERAGGVDDRVGQVEPEHAHATTSSAAASSTGPSTHSRT